MALKLTRISHVTRKQSQSRDANNLWGQIVESEDSAEAEITQTARQEKTEAAQGPRRLGRGKHRGLRIVSPNTEATLRIEIHYLRWGDPPPPGSATLTKRRPGKPSVLRGNSRQSSSLQKLFLPHPPLHHHLFLRRNHRQQCGEPEDISSIGSVAVTTSSITTCIATNWSWT